MISAKILITLALLAVSINCMSKEFKLSENEILTISNEISSNEYLKKEDLKGLFVDVISKTMTNYNWTSDNFPSMFADEILSAILGKEIMIQSKDLETSLKDDKISTLYKHFFKKVVTYLATELDQDVADLEDNFENYGLSFDTYYILTFQIPKKD